MAKDNPKDQKNRRIVKKSETIREKRAKAIKIKPKQRKVRNTASKVRRPVKTLGKFFYKILQFLRPFRFLLWPLKTKLAQFIGRILFKILGIGYFVGSWKELRQVKWPSRGETAKLTLAVFVFASAIAGFIAILDYGLDKIFKQLLT